MTITDTNKQLKKLKKSQLSHYTKMKSDRYLDDNDYSEQYDFLAEDTREIREGELTPYYATNIFEDASSWYLANLQYLIIERNDQEGATVYLQRYAAYSYLAVSGYVYEAYCDAHPGGASLWPDIIYEMLSSSCIIGWENEYVQMNEWVIEYRIWSYQYTHRGGMIHSFMLQVLISVLYHGFCLISTARHIKENTTKAMQNILKI